jgi:hypothetical protein
MSCRKEETIEMEETETPKGQVISFLWPFGEGCWLFICCLPVPHYPLPGEKTYEVYFPGSLLVGFVFKTTNGRYWQEISEEQMGRSYSSFSLLPNSHFFTSFSGSI